MRVIKRRIPQQSDQVSDTEYQPLVAHQEPMRHTVLMVTMWDQHYFFSNVLQISQTLLFMHLSTISINISPTYLIITTHAFSFHFLPVCVFFFCVRRVTHIEDVMCNSDRRAWIIQRFVSSLDTSNFRLWCLAVCVIDELSRGIQTALNGSC